MRINRFVASATQLSRRAADTAVQQGRVRINDKIAQTGDAVAPDDIVLLDGQPIMPLQKLTIIFHKPVGYVTGRDGQGSKTIYDLLPPEVQHLQAVGRLDKDSSGLLLLTNDGELAQQLTHPSFQKIKIYEVALDHPLQPLHRQMISDIGVQLEDGVSSFELERITEGDDTSWRVTMREGRNRQIRRTFAALGYTVQRLHRTQFGNYRLESLPAGSYRPVA